MDRDLDTVADLERLPFTTGSVDTASSSTAYAHIALERLPVALHELHRSLRIGGRAELRMFCEAGNDQHWASQQLHHLFQGAGFTIDTATEPFPDLPGSDIEFTLKRPRSLADCVDGSMRVLILGLNPSLVAADAGFGFAGASNRFWKAAIAADLVGQRGDPRTILAGDHVGFSDLVKRPTARASDLDKREFADGLNRLESLVHLLEPRVVCVLGVTGWRSATGNRTARLGLQQEGLGATPTYVMPNPSGLNAHTNHDDLVAHLREVQRVADG